ncbi:MAG: carboxypeptidase-like regulatory domain-containing protein, partial [Flavitalea sp.]
MKASICAIFTALITIQLLIAAPGFGQGMEEKEITLGLQKESLSDALKKIEDLSGFRIAYSLEDVDRYKGINLAKATRTLEKTLQMVLSRTKLDFRRQNNAIIIYRHQNGDEAAFIFSDESPVPDTTIRGKVFNEKNEPLASASVMVKGTQNGTYTNELGDFVLRNANENATLVISAVGFMPKEIAVNGRTSIELQLAGNTTGMDEVVVTALGISRKTKSLSYATQTVKPSTLTEARDPNNVLNSLQGKVANALITQSSTGVGGDAKILLRGNRSINSSSAALIVIDGIPGGPPGIVPDNIESMTVLTGATGAALYGSEAGNGVIVITTKKGSKDGVVMNFNSSITAEGPFALPKFQNTYGQGGGGNIGSSIGDS